MEKTKNIKEQSAFCKELAIRLDKDINKADYFLTDGKGISGHTMKQSDIKRLRRELMTLSKMMDWNLGI